MHGHALRRPDAVLGHPQHEAVPFLDPFAEVVVEGGFHYLVTL